MLKEIQSVRQIKSENKRRWFQDDFFDLIVWIDDENDIAGFQICYGKIGEQKALTWKKTIGFSHELIDDGENNLGRIKQTPILIPDGHFDSKKIAEIFKKRSRKIEEKISSFIYKKILEY